MCILIHKPAGSEIPEATLRELFNRNRDGYGVAFIDPDKGLLYTKDVGKIEGWEDMFKTYVKKDLNTLIHLRMATDGPCNKDHAHPFPISLYTEPGQPECVMLAAHNGVITKYRGDSAHSDTYLYLYKALQPWIFENKITADRFMNDPAVLKEIEDTSGSGNKLMFLLPDGRVLKTFPAGWVQHFGAFFSNTYAWSPPRPAYSNSGYNYGGYRGEDMADFVFSRGSGVYRGVDASRGVLYYSNEDDTTSKPKRKGRTVVALQRAASTIMRNTLNFLRSDASRGEP